LHRALVAQPKARTVIHLGDGEEEAREVQASFPEKTFYMVRGNCDWGSKLPARLIEKIGGVTFYMTHGYAEHVKYGMDEVEQAARENGAQVLLFGHTHEALTAYDSGLYILNPGSLHGSTGTYGYVDITGAGIVTNIVHLH
jgi:hypothetical protein